MRRREFIPLLFGLIGCIKEEIKSVKVNRIFNVFSSSPGYSTEYQAVLDRSLVIGSQYVSNTLSSSPTVLTMDGCEVIQLGNFVYILGGWNNVTIPYSFNTIYRASISDLTTWTQLPNADWQPRHTFGCGVMNNKIYVWGADFYFGAAAHDCWSATQDVNGNLTWTQLQATLPYSLRGIAGTTIHNGYLYSLGGESNTTETAPTDVWRSADGITWTKVGDGIASFGGNCAGALCSFNESLYVMGGGRYYQYPSGPNYNTKTYLNTIYKSVDDGANWTLVTATLPAACQYTKTVVFDSKLWSLTGFSAGRFCYMDTSEAVTEPTIVNTHWTNSYHALSACKVTVSGTDKLVLVDGTNNLTGLPTSYAGTIEIGYPGYEQPTTTQKGFQNTLMGLIKANGWLSGVTALKCFYVFNYGSSGFSIINWINASLYQLTRSTTAPTWTDGAGFSGNASNMNLIPSGLDPTALSDISETNCSVFAWVNNIMAAADPTVKAIFGGDRSNVNRFYLAPKYSSSNLASNMFAASDVQTAQSNDTKALWHMTRTGSANWLIYRNRVLVGTVTGASSAARFANRLSILSTYSASGLYYSDAQLSCFGFGPAIDNTTLNDTWDAYKTLTGL